MQPISIYIHYPFCVLKCPYCDFNSHVREQVNHAAYIEAYAKELAFFANKLGKRKVKTIFFGGGTPSLMPDELVVSILNNISKYFDLDATAEISLEANPSSVENKKLADFKKAGVNRISLGIQSLNDAHLKFLGRAHNASEARAAVNIAAELFDNFSLDFIYTLPKQNMNEWLDDLKEIFTFAPKHLSLYQLTIEKGTAFYKKFNNKEFTLANDIASAEFYTETTKLCKANGYERYEISNYAKNGFECLHNLNYWDYGEYLGIGAGAHSRVKFDNDLYALMNIHNPEKWLEKSLKDSNAIQQKTLLSQEIINEEKLLLGMRKDSGVSIEDIMINDKKLALLITEGLIQKNQSTIKATNKGALLLNSLISELLTL